MLNWHTHTHTDTHVETCIFSMSYDKVSIALFFLPHTKYTHTSTRWQTLNENKPKILNAQCVIYIQHSLTQTKKKERNSCKKEREGDRETE